MKNPFLRALIVAACFYLLQVALSMSQQRAAPPEVVGEKLGVLLPPFLATAIWARASKRPWPWWRYIATFIPIAFITSILY